MNNAIISFINEINKNGKIHRLCKLFRTKNNFYFYDVGTGKIFEVTSEEYLVLEDLFNNNTLTDDTSKILSEDKIIKVIDKIKEFYYKEKILQAPKLDRFVGPQFDNLEYALNNAKTQLT